MKSSILLISAITAALALLTGCVQDAKENYSLVAGLENKSGTDIAKEVAQLGQAFEFKDFSSGMAKVSAAEASQEEGLNLSLNPWTYNNGWWLRSGEFSATAADGANGFLKGSDDVQFKNAAGAVVQFPVLNSAVTGTVKHQAQLYLEGPRGAYWDVGRAFTLTGTISMEGGDSVLTLNGDLTQYFKAENAAKTEEIHVTGTADAANVKWVRGVSSWGTPVSGTINMESNWRTINIVFEPGVAHVAVAGKTDNYSRSYDVTITNP